MLVLDQNGEPMTIFKVISIASGDIYWQSVEPVFFPDWKYTDFVKTNSLFWDNPHLIGLEGDCLHSKVQIKFGLQDLISASLRADPSQVYWSESVASNYKKVEVEEFPWGPLHPRHLILDAKGKRRHLYIMTDMRTVEGDYGPVTSCYQIDSKSSEASCTGCHQVSFIRNSLEQQGLNYKVVQNGYETILKSHPNYDLYKRYTSRVETVDGLTRKIFNSRTFPIKDWTYYIGVSDSLLKEVWKKISKLLEKPDSWLLDLPRVPLMPVEESFLDDLYETLDRPTMNSFATLLEVAGSLRNLKSLTNCFKKIKKLGGIKKTLVHEGSHLLKDEKLKTASNLYLTKKYVYDTTRMDLEDFFKKYSERMAGLPNMVRHFRYTRQLPNQAGVSTHNFRIDLLPLEQSWADLYGFDLPAEAVWDCIPYSFVVDWFCNIGQSIESVEKLDAIQKLDIFCVIESIKQEWFDTLPIEIDSYELPLSRKFTVYHRTVSKELPPIYPSSPYLSNPFSHILAGAALIFQKKK